MCHYNNILILTYILILSYDDYYKKWIHKLSYLLWFRGPVVMFCNNSKTNKFLLVFSIEQFLFNRLCLNYDLISFFGIEVYRIIRLVIYYYITILN